MHIGRILATGQLTIYSFVHLPAISQSSPQNLSFKNLQETEVLEQEGDSECTVSINPSKILPILID